MMLKQSDSLSDPFPFRNLDLCWLTDLFQLVNNVRQASPSKWKDQRDTWKSV